MIFQVGVKPRATGVYTKVHEDCERAKTTPLTLCPLWVKLMCEDYH
uniref:Uncharacterized protein n=1 Tax=Candidatus Berkiella cookevillensis TaxID=437022 RepID=A0A0Q9YHC8_9GAMM